MHRAGAVEVRGTRADTTPSAGATDAKPELPTTPSTSA